MRFITKLLLGALLIALIPAAASAATVIDEDLNLASDASSFTEVALGTDHQVLWGFDYSGIVGPAPNTGDASTIGVRVTRQSDSGCG